jgi:hypothetical protein
VVGNSATIDRCLSAMARLLVVLPVLAMLHGCSTAFAEKRPWSFVTAVGGLKVESPVHSSGRWFLPIQADVSGVRTITARPTTINSSLICEAVTVRVKGQDIFLVLETALAHGDATSVCPVAKLGRLATGRYNVWYGTSRAEGVSLGAVDVAL